MAGADKIEASKRIVEETRRLYAAVLARAPDEKQLARPAFKFIQDLVRSLIVETRILRDVFNPSDFATGGRTWDRRAKVEFVQELIDYAANNKQPVVGCIAAKVVAGAQPNKTNELLQSLARSAQLKLSGRRPSDERRPRTFTKPVSSANPSSSRRSSSSSSPPQAPATSTQAKASSNTARLSSPASRACSAAKGGGQQQQQRRSPQSGELSAGQTLAATPTRGAKSSASGNAVLPNADGEKPQARRASLIRAPGEQNVPPPSSASMSAAINCATIRRAPAASQQQLRLATTSSAATTIVTIASEGDIGCSVQRLRANLGKLRTLMADLSGTEDLLRESLKQAIGRT